MYIGFHVKYPLFLSDCNDTSIFSTDFRKSTQILNFIKIRPATAEFFHADGRTDGRTNGQTDRHDEANSRFSQFCERAYKRANNGSLNSVAKSTERINTSLSTRQSAY
jgi:hypothetical protein